MYDSSMVVNPNTPEVSMELENVSRKFLVGHEVEGTWQVFFVGAYLAEVVTALEGTGGRQLLHFLEQEGRGNGFAVLRYGHGVELFEILTHRLEILGALRFLVDQERNGAAFVTTGNNYRVSLADGSSEPGRIFADNQDPNSWPNFQESGSEPTVRESVDGSWMGGQGDGVGQLLKPFTSGYRRDSRRRL